MKRIVAMLLALAALACCAGCGASGGGATTTMTEEDFYVYENGEVVYNPITDPEELPGKAFTDTEETKRGIHIGSTFEDVEEAYAGEIGACSFKDKDGYTYMRLEPGALKTEDVFSIMLAYFWDKEGNLKMVDREHLNVKELGNGEYIWISFNTYVLDKDQMGKVSSIDIMKNSF